MTETFGKMVIGRLVLWRINMQGMLRVLYNSFET